MDSPTPTQTTIPTIAIIKADDDPYRRMPVYFSGRKSAYYSRQ